MQQAGVTGLLYHHLTVAQFPWGGGAALAVWGILKVLTPNEIPRVFLNCSYQCGYS